MVKSNAARHLALVVGVLLCFFVYMGYRLRGGSDQPADAGTGVELASLGSGNAASTSPANLVTMSESQPVSLKPPPSSPIVAPPSDATSPAARSGEEAIPDITSLLQADNGAIRPPSSSPASLPPPPSGSFEESSSGGTITGLVPAPPSEKAAGASLPPPPSEAAPAPAPAGAIGDLASLPPPPSGGLKPPSASTQPADSPVAARTPAAPTRQDTPPAPVQRREENKTTVSASAPATSSAAPAAPVSPTQPRSEPPAASRPAAPVQPRQSPAVQPPSAGPTRRPGDGDAVSETLRIYVVRPGDTLSRIAARELGSNTLADNIFLLNRDVIDDPDHLVVGARIRLPVRESLGAASTPSPVVAPPATNAPVPGSRVRVHTVARGETLSSIALRYYGASSGWRYLYEANQKTIPNPNQLTVGTELVIPPYGE